jgi:hypothetical protein
MMLSAIVSVRIAIHYLTQETAIAILEKWVGCDRKQKTDIFSDRQFNQIFNRRLLHCAIN